MAIAITVTGNGYYQGSSTSLTSYSVSEEATPLDPADSTGATGQFTFGLAEDPDGEGTLLLYDDTIELTDASNGRTQGTVTEVSVQDGTATISADSRLAKLVYNTKASAFTGTLNDALMYYFSLAGETTGIVIDPIIGARTVTYQNFEGNLWDVLKQICAAQQIEISLVSSNIVVRAVRTRVAEIRKHTSETITVTKQDTARTVEVNYYNNVRRTNTLVYPKDGWTSDLQSYQVNAGEVIEIDIPVDISLETIQQPVVQDYIDRYYTGPTSAYAVAGNDGLPIKAAQWAAQGGSIVASIGDDGKTIHLKITGASEAKYSPYSIAVTAGPSDRYSSLRLIGTGVFFSKQTYTALTATDPAKTANPIGITVDNPFISTYADAQDLAVKVANRYAGPNQMISINASVINRRGDIGTMNYPTFAKFNSDNAGLTFAQFNTLWAGKTFQQFNSAYNATVQDAFENQAFGNAVGARVKYRDSWYRIRSATITPSGISFTAEQDNIFSDFNTVWAGKTFADFNAQWSGKRFVDFNIIPMWKV
jgi:hypothetical protein